MEQASGKKILVINGHPWKGSFCASIVDTYATAASNGAQVQTLQLRELRYDLAFLESDPDNGTKDPVVKACQDQLLWADHLVFVFPTWWTNMPAILKGYIDQVFASGVAFRYQAGKSFPEQLLKGRTARIIVTMDAPSWYNKWFTHAPQTHALKKGTLEFCGVKPVKVTTFGMVRDSPVEKRQLWLGNVRTLAEQEVLG